MSSKYRRQSIYLQRKSFSRANSSIDPYDDSDHSVSNMGGSASALAAQAPPPPNLESMKVIKGFEFVTFTPVEIRPQSQNGGVELSTIVSSDLETDQSNSSSPESSRASGLVRTYSSAHSTTTNTMVKSFDLERMPDNIASNEITDSEARDALHNYVSNKFCYGTKAASRMTIRDMIPSFVFQYSLESFCEKRELCWTYEPYADACITLPENCGMSIPDNAWNLEVNEIKHLEWYLEQQELSNKSPAILPPGPSSNTLSVNNGASSSLSRSNSSASAALQCKLNGKSSSFRKVMEAKERQRLRRASSTTSGAGGQSVDLFQNKTINVIVPGTVSIHSCHNCGGVGRKRCTTCAGSGTKSCQSCTGNGYYGGYYHKSALTKSLESSDYCWRCHGRGRLRCYNCNGDGMITCAACLGSGQIKCYIKMIVTLTNHQDTVLIRDHNSAEVPIDVLNLADGDIIFEEEGHNLYHITNYIDESITRESERLIRLHEEAHLRHSRLILQRHRIKVIPIAKVIAFWQRKQFHFYVFGSQHHRCYTANYPQKYSCACCCII